MTAQQVRTHYLSSHQPGYWEFFSLDMAVNQWASYAILASKGEIYSLTRKEQRYYQRKFCSFFSRRQHFIDSHPEYFL